MTKRQDAANFRARFDAMLAEVDRVVTPQWLSTLPTDKLTKLPSFDETDVECELQRQFDIPEVPVDWRRKRRLAQLVQARLDALLAAQELRLDRHDPYGLLYVLPEDADQFEQRGIKVERDGITLTWGGDEYWITAERIRTCAQALHWVHHLLGKTWMTPYRAELFIEAAAKLNAWTHGVDEVREEPRKTT